MSTVQAEPTLVLRPELAGTLMTPEEFDAADFLDDDDWHVYELIQGMLIVTPPPLEGERGPNELLGYLLLDYQYNHPEGSALDLTLPEHTIRTARSRRRADRVLWVGLGRVPNVRRDLPAIAAEFVSRARRDRHRDYVLKREEYMEAGLQEYWIIDRFRRWMTVVRPGQPELVVREEEIYRTPLLPGFELPLARLLALADGLEQSSGDGEEEDE